MKTNHQLSKKNGVTLIELLLVIALIALIGATATPFLSRFVLQTNHDTAIDNLVGSIRKAQEYAMDGKDNETWGVCLSSGNIRLYSGSCGSPTFQEEFDVASSISISNLSDTTFNIRGEPSGALNITVSSAIDSNSIQMNSAGGLTVN